MSAHVVPKAHAFSEVDEDEKTTIESGWEEEASTTVEQGEVAEKIRALGTEQPALQRVTTNVTSTNATNVEEPTVDDQHANALISVLTPPTQAVAMARLVVTQGNDSGQELEIRPDKTYTIGRAIDNDLVLTDISVSRKHFDLRNEDGSWVVIDRGSGNGTVVNGAIEDHPFMLASGDLIEIGNTIFRFDLPNNLAETPLPSQSRASSEHIPPSYDVDMDEEPSTVAGKAVVREELPPAQLPRPKTMPPPMPMRARQPTAPPAFAPPAPASTLPLPQMANSRPAPQHAPTMLGGGIQMPVSTLPGQGVPRPNSQPPFIAASQPLHETPFSYPNGSDVLRQHAPSHPQMLVMSNGMQRDAPSTALVPPTPYNGTPAIYAPQQPYVVPQLSRRTKMIAGGAALTLLAAIATVAIVKGAGGKPAAALPALPSKPSVEPIVDPKGSKIEPTKVDTTKVATVDPKKVEPTKVDTTKIDTKVEPPKIETTKVETKKIEPTKIEPAKIETTKVDTTKIDTRIDPKVDPKVDPKKIEATKVDPKKVDPKKVDPKKVDPKKTPRVTTPRVDPVKVEPTKIVETTDPPPSDPKKIKPLKRGGGDKPPTDTSGFKAAAATLYRNKDFAGAASSLKKAAGTLTNQLDINELTNLASTYDQFGKAYNAGMAPGTKDKDAYPLLRKAIGYDFGGNFKGELNQRLTAVAPGAASSFMARGSYADALAAVRQAESGGNSNNTTADIRKTLDAKAGELINEASKELDSNASEAKGKLQKAQTWLEPKNPLYAKAGKLLANL